MTLASTVTTDLELSTDIETTQTYKISDDKIQGFIDDLDALKQFVYIVLNTEQSEYPIYDLDYGIALNDLIGKDRIYVEAELQRRITDCLETDDRINSVDNFAFTVTDDELLCTFDVNSIYGTTTASTGVTV